MPFDRHKHHRRSVRLRGYDYSWPGAYYVTICTYGRECVFGAVRRRAVRLNEYGRVARDEWLRSASVRPGIVLDAFVVMPNHVHGIIILTPESQSTKLVGAHVGAYSCTPLPPLPDAPLPDTPLPPPEQQPPLQRRPRSLSSFVACYKATVTRRVNALRDSPGARVWQRNYYEHIIRDDDDLARVRGYIITNPARWADDDYYTP
jgi:REP element-mobilizing transposase RayT